MQRADLASLTSTRFDLAAIGGGINGVAIARDAAMRGMDVVLLEREDLSSGTSAWSSRLIHGGLRYLEHREFGLVRESLRERERLLRNAPHLVEPLPMVLPVYKGARRGPLLIRAGMALYDGLSWDKSLPLHRMLDPDDVLERLPGLNADGLRAAARFYDAQVTFSERLVIEQAVSAWEHGAQIATRAEVTRIRTDGAVLTGLEVRDGPTGETVPIQARTVVNVAGPWVDRVLSEAPRGAINERFIGGTKGSHIVVERWEGAPTDAIYYESRSDGRPILIIPWNGMILLGSTDLRFEGDLDRVEVSDAEAEYLLSETNALYPELNLSLDDVLYGYAGVRPLPFVSGKSTGAITRRHLIRNHAPKVRGLWSVIGGKLTTHRSLAEEVVDTIGKAIDRRTPCRTNHTPLPGASGIVHEAFEAGFVSHGVRAGLNDLSARRLANLYGARAEQILAIVRAKPDLAQVVDAESGAMAAEAVFAVEQEMAASLADIMLRRTMLAYGPAAGIGADQAVLDAAGKAIGWTQARQRAELAEFRDWITRYRPRSLESVDQSTANAPQ